MTSAVCRAIGIGICRTSAHLWSADICAIILKEGFAFWRLSHFPHEGVTMKASCTICLIAILALAITAAAAESPAASAPAKPLSDYFPPETIAYVDCGSVPAVIEGAKGTGLYALWNDDSLAAVRRYLDDLSKKPGSSGGAEGLAAMRDFFVAIPGGFALGVYQANAGTQWLAVAEVGIDSSAARTFLDKMNATAASPVKEVEIHAVKSSVIEKTDVCSTVVDGLCLVGSREAFTWAIDHRSARSSDLSLSTSVGFVKASAFLSNGPRAYRAFVDFTALLEKIKAQMPPDSPLKLTEMMDSFGLGDVETVSLEGAFRMSGVTEHIYISTKSPESRLIDLTGRDTFDESRLSVVPRTALVAGGRSLDAAAHYRSALDVLKLVQPLSGFDAAAMLQSLELRSGLSVERDVIPAFGKTSVFYYDMPEGASLEGVAAGGGVYQAAMMEVTDAEKMKAALERFASAAEADPALANPAKQQATPAFKLETATLGDLKIYYASVPGMPAVTPAAAVSNGYLVYASSKESVKAVIDRLIAPGPSIVDTADYARVRQALPKPVAQIGYVNLDRVIDFVYDNFMKMLATKVDIAHRDNGCPLTSANIPSAYVVKKYIDGVGVSCSASGNLIDMCVYTPTGGAVLIPAAVVIPLLARQVNATAPAGGASPASVDSTAAESAPDAARDRLVKIGGKLQLSTIDRKGKFPDRLEDVIEPAMLRAPQAPAGDTAADYIYVPGYTMNSAGKSVLVYERKGLQPDGRHVLFVSGAVEFVSESDFEKLVGTSGQ